MGLYIVVCSLTLGLLMVEQDKCYIAEEDGCASNKSCSKFLL